MIVSNYKNIGKGQLIAAFDLELSSGMILYGCKLFFKGSTRWITPPQRDFMLNGKRQYEPVVGFKDKATGQKFSAQVVAVLDSKGLGKIPESTPAATEQQHFSGDADIPF